MTPEPNTDEVRDTYTKRKGHTLQYWWILKNGDINSAVCHAEDEESADLVLAALNSQATSSPSTTEVVGELVSRVKAAHSDRVTQLQEGMAEPDIAIINDHLVDLYSDVIAALSQQTSTTDGTFKGIETQDQFKEWFYSAPHRKKYPTDHPAYLAALETWKRALSQQPSTSSGVVISRECAERAKGWAFECHRRYCNLELAAKKEGQDGAEAYHRNLADLALRDEKEIEQALQEQQQ